MSNTSARAALGLRLVMGALLGSTAMAVAIIAAPAAMAQETSAVLTGIVLDGKGFSAENASVEVTHVPSGTTRVVTTNEAGRFEITGLRVGGPYTVKVTGQGLKEKVVKDQFLQLAAPKDLTIKTDGAAAQVVETVEVTGVRRAFRTGTATDFNVEKVALAPTISHDLKDVARQDPRVQIDPTNANAISIAGTNNRFNSLTVDGVRQNDDFGLNGNGYPTQRAPIALDWVDQLSVLTAPYDVLYSGFQGGTINVTTKSGTNTFHGAGYGYMSTPDMAGDTAFGKTFKQTSENQTAGGLISGPVIKDKLFFFAGWERYDGTRAQQTGPAGTSVANPVSVISQDQFNQILAASNSKYGFDPGGSGRAFDEYQTNLLLKLDWNITDKHRASAQYQESKGSVIIDQGNGATAIGTASNWYANNQGLRAATVQIFSDWTSNFSTEFKYGHKRVRTVPTSLGGYALGQMTVSTLPVTSGSGNVVIGPDISRQSNLLTNATDQFKAKGTYLLGDHSVTGGWERETVDVFNMFVQRSLGDWGFNSIADFAAGNAFQLRYQNAISGNINDAAAAFGYAKDSFYLQDKWTVNDRLSIQGGVRYERYFTDDKPKLNANFVSHYGFANTSTYDGKDAFLPRLGFNWRPLDDTTVRGGAGLFSGTGPNVWLSNSFSNDGVTLNAACIYNSKSPGLATSRVTAGCTDVSGNPALLSVLTNANPKSIPAAVQALLQNQATIPLATTNSVDPNLKVPTSWRYSFTVEQNVDLGWFGKDYTFAGDVIYTKVQDAFVYKDLRLIRNPAYPTAPDGRPVYIRNTFGAAGTTANDDIYLTNTHQGDGLVFSVSAKKQWETKFGDFAGFLAYTHQSINEVNPLTSSVALSNYTNVTTSDPNNMQNTRSNYEIEHDFRATFDWGKDIISGYRTFFSLFGDRRTGLPYSYTFGSSSSGTGLIGFVDPSIGRQLFYVPKDANDVILSGGLTWDQLDAFIKANGLDKYRGQIAPRNAFNSRWVTTIDMRFAQEIPGLFDGHKGLFSLDIKNVGNLLNKNWGRLEQIGFPYNAQVANAAIDPKTGKYVYTPISGRAAGSYLAIPRDTSNQQAIDASVWRIQVGLRYEF